MTYVMSDIHGNYEKYKQALETISFKDRDILYVLGDVIDRGEDSMKILLDMMCRINVIPLVGNHEFMAMSILPELVKDGVKMEDLSPDFLLQATQWQANGGEKTLKGFRELDKEQRESVLEYLEEFECYQEITVKKQDYVLSHAGIHNYVPNQDMEDYPVQDLIFKRMDYSIPCFPDKILISGHTPTRNIHGKDEIYHGNNHIALDCGCGWGGPLAVLCLETGKEYYATGR